MAEERILFTDDFVITPQGSSVSNIPSEAELIRQATLISHLTIMQLPYWIGFQGPLIIHSWELQEVEPAEK